MICYIKLIMRKMAYLWKRILQKMAKCLEEILQKVANALTLYTKYNNMLAKET